MAAQARREHLIAEAFVELADTLVADFDIVEFLHRLCDRCLRLLRVSAAAVILADPDDRLQMLAASPDSALIRELLHVDTADGPARHCYRTGEPVHHPGRFRLQGLRQWPEFADLAARGGFRSGQALPMRLRARTIGVLSLFADAPATLDQYDQRLAQAFADVATIGLMQQRTLRQRQTLAEQLQTALDTRIVIEQAKGVLAERHNVDMQTAFQMLRQQARSTRRQIHDLARGIVEASGDATAP